MVSREHVLRVLARLPEIEAGLSSPAVAANRKQYQTLVREHSTLRQIQEKSDRYFRLVQDRDEQRELIAAEKADPEMAALAKAEIAATEATLPQAEKALLQALLPPDPRDARNALVEVRAGTGGDEAALFAGDLFRMYSRYAEARGWKVAPIDSSYSEIGGYKEIIFEVVGQGAYGTLKYESGGHRVQRIPVTESAGRIHTSAATVGVFPEADEDDDIEIKPDEIRVDIFCASGPGGQGVNTTYSAIRITQLPTGLVAQSQDERSQHRNREKAMSVLKSRLLDMRRRAEEEKKGEFRRSTVGTGDRSDRIRTYNFPQNRLTDHRINLTIYDLTRIVEGDLDEVIAALRDDEMATRMKTELAGG